MDNTSQNTNSSFNLWQVFVRLQNPLMMGLLKSPIHFFVSKWYLLISVTGRKSGRIYSTPVQYKQVGNSLHIISNKKYKWWRNLRGGADVTLRLRGQSIIAKADVSEHQVDVEGAFIALYPGVKEETRQKMVADCVAIRVEISA